jgi:large exoprotein involved in heme utilization and adhesion
MIPRQALSRRFRCFLIELCTSSVLVAVWLAVSQAQVRTTITPDNSLGTTVIRQGRVYDITGGTRPGDNGPNRHYPE